MSSTWEEIEGVLCEHKTWRKNCLNLIASENVTGPTVQRMLSEDLAHRYGDYLGIDSDNRKYFGNRYIREIEERAVELGKRLFRCRFMDLRPLSGHVAGNAVIMALCKPGDVVMEIGSDGCGHRLAEKLTASPLVNLDIRNISMISEPYNIDLESTLEMMREVRPKLVILGSSCFLFPHPVAEIKHEVERIGEGCLMYDASHVAGLIAGGLFQNPLEEGADVICSSTHKTMGGPQGGMILTNNLGLAERIGNTLYPALITNHHLNRFLASAVNFCELLDYGRAYAEAVVRNAKELARSLDEVGLKVIGKSEGYTLSHTVLLDTGEFGGGRLIAERFEAADIILGPTKIPKPAGSEGQRIGVQEVTRLGMGEEEMRRIAILLSRVLYGDDPEVVKHDVAGLTGSFHGVQYAY